MKRSFGFGFSVAVVAIALFLLSMQTRAQAPQANSASPTVVHIHHHHYYNSPNSSLISAYNPRTAWNFGMQPTSGTLFEPWQMDWGHLGFTGYLGQHGGGIDITPDSLDVFQGLVVETVKPGSPAAKMGLVEGDFIREINGVQVDSYKQVAELFEQSEANPNAPLALEVWNPHTRRTSTLRAFYASDNESVSEGATSEP